MVGKLWKACQVLNPIIKPMPGDGSYHPSPTSGKLGMVSCPHHRPCRKNGSQTRSTDPAAWRLRPGSQARGVSSLSALPSAPLILAGSAGQMEINYIGHRLQQLRPAISSWVSACETHNIHIYTPNQLMVAGPRIAEWQRLNRRLRRRLELATHLQAVGGMVGASTAYNSMIIWYTMIFCIYKYSIV